MLNELCGINGQRSSQNSQKLLAGEREIVTRLRIEGPMGVNELARGLGQSAGVVLARIMQMEMRGIVVEDRGMWKML